MALRLLEPWDTVLTVADRGWNGSALSSSTGAGRNGGRGVALASGSQLTKDMADLGFSGATVIFGFAFNPQAMPAAHAATNFLFRLFDAQAGAAIVQVGMTSDGKLDAYRGSTQLGISTNTVTLSAWCTLEVKIVLDAAAGSVTVRQNGTTIWTLTGQNTLGSPTFTRFDLGTTTAGTVFWVDDCFWFDGSGSRNNDFLVDPLVGELRVGWCLPKADGTANDFTRSTGSDGWSLVDSAQPDDADYLKDRTAGHRQGFKINPVQTAKFVHGVQLAPRLQKTGPTARGAKAYAIGSATEVSRTLAPLPGATTPLTPDVYALDTAPNGTAWSYAKLKSLEVGVEIT